ncbi:MAG: lipid hydroperoxide peroxidase, partial [Nitrosomonadaceae bacterium]
MVTLAGTPIKVEGIFPKVGTKAPAFSLVNK